MTDDSGEHAPDHGASDDDLSDDDGDVSDYDGVSDDCDASEHHDASDDGGPGDGPTDTDAETLRERWTDLDDVRRDASSQARARALQSLLTEEGVLPEGAVEEVMSVYEREIGPLNGARIVARAWTDPDFEERLLEDATSAVAELDLETQVQNVRLQAVKNTADRHNLVVCTLCSCYPWAVLGLPPTWYKSEAYRSRAVREPRTLLREEFGIDLTDDVDVEVWDSTSELRYFVVPRRPPGTESYTESELVELVSRDAMIGVERLDRPPASDGGASRSPAAALDLPIDAEPTFSAPWQGRAFAIAVALTDREYPWSAFQRRLVAELPHEAADPDGSDAVESGLPGDHSGVESRYFGSWLDALEATAVDRGLLDPSDLLARTADFDAGERTAHEFVEGEHDHGHD